MTDDELVRWAEAKEVKGLLVPIAIELTKRLQDRITEEDSAIALKEKIDLMRSDFEIPDEY